MSSRRRRCYTVNVDGIAARVYAAGPLSERDVEAIREIARCLRNIGAQANEAVFVKADVPTGAPSNGEETRENPGPHR